MKVIIVTGTPGTGKTTLAKELAKKLEYLCVDVNDIIKKYDISEGYDIKRKTKIIDIKKLNIALIKEINYYKQLTQNKINNKNNNGENGLVIDSHLSQYLPKRYVDLCIVTKCSLKELESRLRKKKYSREKIRENLDAEIFDVCLNEAKEQKHKVIVEDTTKNIKIDVLSKEIRSIIQPN